MSPAAHWSYLQSSAKQPTLGKIVDDAMVVIERDNPRLKGVLPKDYARPALDKYHLSELSRRLIQHKAKYYRLRRVFTERGEWEACCSSSSPAWKRRPTGPPDASSPPAICSTRRSPAVAPSCRPRSVPRNLSDW